MMEPLPPSPNQPLVVCENLVLIYQIADLEVVALQGLELEVEPGEMVALVGPSGAGKSSLLNLLAGLTTPTAGRLRVGDFDLLDLSQSERLAYTRHMIGFVRQQPDRNLLPYLTARENVIQPLAAAGVAAGRRRERAAELLDMLDLVDQADQLPEALSGGQQQRAALAVALANRPQLLLADEPTGQLDSASAGQLFDALRRANRQLGTTVILVTHDPAVAARVDRVISIRDGRTSTEIRRLTGQDGGQDEEWVILDRSGRLQIPAVYLETLALRGRVRVRREADHLSLWPAAGDGQSGDALRHWRPTGLIQFPDSPAEDPAPEPSPGAAVALENVTRTFQRGEEQVLAVNDVSLTLPQGQLIVLKGRSGSGKTTLLNLIGGLDEPTAGQLTLFGRPQAALTPAERLEFRRRRLGFVFQTFGLLPFLTARENIEVPLRLLAWHTEVRQRRSTALLEAVGLDGRANHRVQELSGGEQQRVAIARALAARPWLLLADEPTGQLDTTTGSDIVALLQAAAHQLNTTVIIASHDAKVAGAADLHFELQDGRLLP